MCGGAREHRCWNGVTFDGALAAARITSEAHAAIEELEGFDPAFLRLVHDEAGRLDEDRQRRIDGLTAQLGEIRLEVQNLLRFVRGGDSSVSVREDLKQSEQREADLASKLTLVEREPTHTVDVPEVQQLKELGRDCLQDLDHGSEAFARVLRRLVPRVSVFPVRLCDGGRVVLRGRLTIRLSELLVDGKARDVLRRPLERERTIDLFDPPQRAVFRKQVSALRASGLSERAAAAELGITVTAAQAAIKLQRRMDVLNISDPYVLVGEPPVDCSKLRRHLHPDYRFEPLMLTRET
jgi:site-specific DNA recombinase